MNLETSDAVPIEYRDIPSFPGYRVGCDGSVWSSRKPGNGYGTRKPWVQLRTSPDTEGRPSLSLRRDRKTFHVIVAHVVAEAFHGPRPDGLLVLHDNGNQEDNRASNLKYGTYVENEKDKARHGRKMTGATHPGAKLDADRVRSIKAALGSQPSRGVVASLARKNGVDEAVIARIRDGKAWAWVV